MNITITQSDIERIKLSNSPSGMLIDELAFSIGEWTSDDLSSNNFEYEPREPYDYDYEADLFNATKTNDQLSGLVTKLCSPNLYISFKDEETKDMQAGAYCALKYPEDWQTILSAYKEKLQEDNTDGISEAYNKALEKEINEYQKDQYHEWLHGDHRDWDGIVRAISKYYTEDRNNGEYIPYNDKTDADASYIFEMDEDQLHEDYCACGDELKDCNILQDYKGNLLATIQSASDNHASKKREERAKRADERKRRDEQFAKYKAQAEAERIAKLKAMKI